MANDIIKKEQGFLQDVSVELASRLENEREVFGGTFNKQRFIMNSLEALRQLEIMDKPVTPKQVSECLMKGAYLNLDFFRKECYLIYYNGRGLQFQTDYKGEIKLVKKYSIKPIFEIYAEVVRVGDEFEKTIVNGNRTINHKPKRFNDGQIEGAYAFVKYTDGSSDLVTISAKDIETIRVKYSKAPKSGAWENRYEEMCKKTALRLLCKQIQLDFTKEQYQAYNDGGDCEFNNTKHTDEIALNPFENTPHTDPDPQVIDVEVVNIPATPTDLAGEEEEPTEEEPAQLVCVECGAEVTAKVANYSLDKFGKVFCYKCQKKQ